ncbi:LysR substrate-binding domain-containing protein [Spirosoma sp.]|uniref:LysR substrate-binding domain-containing protein n=1 Tax=Spirosoma sp. TaxID=1899569 RepID=UPI00263731B0|nr:LysR substrate-binding domain-containing protein [Spirosoma sp.]MCX6219226.1 LysR substrate-binding domain-containing protein [Spirosoma sp.]
MWVVSIGKYARPYFLAGCMRQHEGIELVMDVTNQQKVIDSLAKNEVDFALVSILLQKLNVNYLELMPNKLYVVGRRLDEPASLNNYLRLLEKLPLIYREAGSSTRSMMEPFIMDHQLVVRKRLELTSNKAIKQALLAGPSYSIYPTMLMLTTAVMSNLASLIGCG